MPDSQTLKDRATQLLIKYKSGALVTHCNGEDFCLPFFLNVIIVIITIIILILIIYSVICTRAPTWHGGGELRGVVQQSLPACRVVLLIINYSIQDKSVFMVLKTRNRQNGNSGGQPSKPFWRDFEKSEGTAENFRR